MNYIHDISGKQFCGYDDKPFLKVGKQKCGFTIGQEVNVTHKRHLPPTFAFTDLPHHRTCGSAYGGSYFGCHSRYEPISVTYPVLRRLSLLIAIFKIGLSATRQYPRRLLPHIQAWYLSIPHLTRLAILVLTLFQDFHIHMRIRLRSHLSVSRSSCFIFAR